MSNTALPPISTVPTLSTTSRAALLDLLFEPSVPLHTLSVSLLQEHTFTSYDDLITSVGAQLSTLAESSSSSDLRWLESILGAHPRLGAKKVDSAQSAAEQAQLNTGGEDEARELAALNQRYEDTFPGLRYVVFVNGRSRAVVMEDMRERIGRGSVSAERAEAIRVCVHCSRSSEVGWTVCNC